MKKMKKGLALILAATLLTGAAALAETVTVEKAAHDFNVTMVIPEGYALTEQRDPGGVRLSVTSPGEDSPNFDITVAYSEEYSGVTLNQLSADEKQALLATMDDDFLNPVVHDLVTEHGTEVFLINEDGQGSESFFAAGFSIYKGYFVQIYAAKPNFQRLAQADLDLAMKLLSDMWFVDQ